MLNMKFIQGREYKRIRKYFNRRKNSELMEIIEELEIDVSNTYLGGRDNKSVIICNELEKRGKIKRSKRH